MSPAIIVIYAVPDAFNAGYVRRCVYARVHLQMYSAYMCYIIGESRARAIAAFFARTRQGFRA